MRSPCEKPFALRLAIAPRSSRAIERVDARCERRLGYARASARSTRCSRAPSAADRAPSCAAARRACGGPRAARPRDRCRRCAPRRHRACSTVERMRRHVDLPAPFGPSSPVIRPSPRLEAHAVEGAHGAEPLADAVDLDHGAGPSRLKKNGVGGSRSRQLASSSAGIGCVEERAQEPRHAADADEPVALAAADQVHAVAQARRP